MVNDQLVTNTLELAHAVLDLSLDCLDKNPKKEFVAMVVVFKRLPKLGEIAFDFTPDN